MNQKPSIAIVGTGALGGYYGGLIAKAGFETRFLLRSDYEHVSANGLSIRSPNGDFHLESVNAFDNAADIPPTDIIFVCLKTTARESLRHLLPAICHPSSIVVSLQNGLDVEHDIAASIDALEPTISIVGGCCFLCANKTGPGEILHLDYGRISLAVYRSGQKTNPAADVADVLCSSSIETVVSTDLRAMRWNKLLWNIPFNGLSVVNDASTADLLSDPVSRSHVVELMHEVIAIAEADGCNIQASVIEQQIASTEAMVPYDSSMRIDYKQGRPLEIETIITRPLETAIKHRVASPRLAELHRDLLAISDKPR